MTDGAHADDEGGEPAPAPVDPKGASAEGRFARALRSMPTWGWILFATLVMLVINTANIAACGPWDPWETHYGEVARQILARHDPIDLWWKPGYGPDGAAERTFWSKPALPFWLMALSMKIFGVGTGAFDEMVRSPWPEISIRLPSMIAGMSSAAFLGYAVWRVGEPRGTTDSITRTRARAAGILTALALATMPQWAIVTRQALTDMFFVGPVVVAMGAWVLAFIQPERELTTRPLPSWGPLKPLARRGWRIPWDRAYLGFLLVLALSVIPQIAVLHHHALSDITEARVAKFVKKPGVPNLYTLYQIHLTMVFYWALTLATVLLSLRWRRRSSCWMGVMYLAAGLSLVGKGMIGPGLVGLLVLVDMIVRRRFSLLPRCGLVSGTLLFTLTAMPWHHAMYLFRGDSWFNELIVVNNLTRFDTGEQEQAVGTFVFYVQTLGLASLPWIAAVPAALWEGVRRAFTTAPPEDDHGLTPAGPWAAIELRRFALLWFVVSLFLITYSVTKYYHYLLPVLPPLAVIVGLWLGDLVAGSGAKRSSASADTPGARWVAAGIGVVIAALVVRDAIHQPAWIAHLTTYLYTSMWREGAPEVTRLVYVTAPFALGLACWAARRLRVAALCMALSGVATTTYIIDDYLPAASENWSQRTAIQIYYDHRGPDDPLLSWWFYYRGETFFSKARVWVVREREKKKLAEYVKKVEEEIAAQGKSGVSLWMMTTTHHAKRARSTLPTRLRGGMEIAYENFHYTLIRVPIPDPQ